MQAYTATLTITFDAENETSANAALHAAFAGGAEYAEKHVGVAILEDPRELVAWERAVALACSYRYCADCGRAVPRAEIIEDRCIPCDAAILHADSLAWMLSFASAEELAER